MSHNNPIPVRLRPAFTAHMDAHNLDDLPDGAWFQVLQDAAAEFIKKNRLQYADENAATHQYLHMKEESSHEQPA